MSDWLQFSEPMNNNLFQLRMAINDMWILFMLLHAVVYPLLFPRRGKEMKDFVCWYWHTPAVTDMLRGAELHACSVNGSVVVLYFNMFSDVL
jgi:hypothetical protein